MENYTEKEIAEALQGMLVWGDEPSFEIDNARSYSDAGVMTYNEGLVIHLRNGQTFQLTVVEC